MNDYGTVLGSIQDGICPICNKGLTTHDFDNWGMEGYAECQPCGLKYEFEKPHNSYLFSNYKFDYICIDDSVFDIEETPTEKQEKAIVKEERKMIKVALMVSLHSRLIKRSLEYKSELLELYNTMKWRDEEHNFIYATEHFKLAKTFTEQYNANKWESRLGCGKQMKEAEVRLMALLFVHHLEESNENTVKYRVI